MEKPTFVFDDVRIPPARQIGRHSHPQWEISMVITGKGERTIGDRTEEAREGEIIFIPPDIPHEWRFDPEVTDEEGNIANISVFFDPRFLEGIETLLPELAQTVNHVRHMTQALSYQGETKRRIRELLLEMRGLTARGRLPMMADLLEALDNVGEGRTVGSGRMLSKAEERLERIRVFCACNYAREISLGEVAAYAGMNRSSFCTFMRRHTGMNFSEYINSIRLDRAIVRLVQTDDRISAIAYDAGFTTPSYFNRLFLARYGETPRAFREQSRRRRERGK